MRPRMLRHSTTSIFLEIQKTNINHYSIFESRFLEMVISWYKATTLLATFKPVFQKPHVDNQINTVFTGQTTEVLGNLAIKNPHGRNFPFILKITFCACAKNDGFLMLKFFCKKHLKGKIQLQASHTHLTLSLTLHPGKFNWLHLSLKFLCTSLAITSWSNRGWTLPR